MKFDILVFFENLSSKFQFRNNLTRITVTLQEDRRTFVIISHSFLLRMGNVLDEICRQNQNSRFMFNSIFFFENHAVHEIIWKNSVQPDRSQMTVYYGAFALHAGQIRLQTDTQNMKCFLPFLWINSCTKAPRC